MKALSFEEIKKQKFGRLQAIEDGWIERSGRRLRQIICRCDCGNVIKTLLRNLRIGDTRSCGCFRSDEVIKRSTRHGLTPSGNPLPSEYRTWAGMIQRCENPKNKDYSYYGGRGVTVCERWHTFINFYTDMGERPKGKSLDRIDNSKGYTPTNCRWATHSEQMRNRRSWKKLKTKN